MNQKIAAQPMYFDVFPAAFAHQLLNFCRTIKINGTTICIQTKPTRQRAQRPAFGKKKYSIGRDISTHPLK